MNHKELITRLRSGAVIELEQFAFGGVATFADEAADMIEAAIAERDALRQQLAEAQARIEPPPKPVGMYYNGGTSFYVTLPNRTPLYTTPVVADDVKQYGDDRAREALEMAAVLAGETVCDTHIPTGVKIYGTRAGKAIRALKDSIK